MNIGISFMHLKSFLPKNYVLVYNNAEYSKLASGPVWFEILSNILPFASKSKIEVSNDDLMSTLRFPPPKLALFSAHDGTVQMLMASLGKAMFNGTEWAPFASYFAIEIHEVLDVPDEKKVVFPSGNAFRIIYNGNVFTSKIEGCPIEPSSELCDLLHLIKVLEPIAIIKRSCEKSSRKEDHDFGSIFDKRKNIAIVITISMLSGFLGSILTLSYLGKGFDCNRLNRGSKYKSFGKTDADVIPGSDLPDFS